MRVAVCVAGCLCKYCIFACVSSAGRSDFILLATCSVMFQTESSKA